MLSIQVEFPGHLKKNATLRVPSVNTIKSKFLHTDSIIKAKKRMMLSMKYIASYDINHHGKLILKIHRLTFTF